jgi:hypothetical protein
VKKRLEVRRDTHVHLLTDIDNIPQELVEKGRSELLMSPIIPAGTRLHLSRYRERRITTTRVYISYHGELCQWVERHSDKDSTIAFEPLPTVKQINELGIGTVASRRAKAKRRLSADVYAALSDPIHDFESVMDGMEREERNLLHYLYVVGKISLDDITDASEHHPKEEWQL